MGPLLTTRQPRSRSRPCKTGPRASASRFRARRCPTSRSSSATTRSSTRSSAPQSAANMVKIGAHGISYGRQRGVRRAHRARARPTQSKSTARPTRRWHGRRGRRQRHPAHLRPRPTASIAQGATRPREEDRPRAGRPGRGQRRRAVTATRICRPAAPPAQQPVLVGAGDRRSRVLGLHDTGRTAGAVADAHRPAALLPRSPGLHRLRRAPADLQAEAAAERTTAICARAPRKASLNYLTPHGKWHIHSTYGDNHRMLTLSRGIEPCG